MKRALILHGTDGSPGSNWLPWLKSTLKTKGYEVWTPQLPDCHTPNRETYGDFLFSQGWDFTDNIVLGHSSGAVEVLNLLMDERLPHIKLAVMVGAWAELDVPDGYKENILAAGLSREQFLNLFPPQGFDFALMKSKADHIVFLHGSDDPFCPLEQAEYLAKALDAPIMVVPDGHHLGSRFTELPELWQIIEPSL
jgi:predicted alpha/beta hydrolase family esterase